MNILHFMDGLTRTISKGRPSKTDLEHVRDGLDTLQNIRYNKIGHMLDVTDFVCSFQVNTNPSTISIFKPPQPVRVPHRLGKMFS
jgi:hypothetical protein